MTSSSDIDIVFGWCFNFFRCGGVGVECVRAPGGGEACVACLARELGLPTDTAAGNVVAEILRRDGRTAA